MPFLVIASLTVPAVEVSKRIERIGSSSRSFTGALRSTVRAEKRTWQVTTGMMTSSSAVAIEAAIANGAQVTCSGDALGATVTCEVEAGDGAYPMYEAGDALSFSRTLTLTLREV